MEEEKEFAPMPEDIYEYIYKGITEYEWSDGYVIQDLARYGIDSERAKELLKDTKARYELGGWYKIKTALSNAGGWIIAILVFLAICGNSVFNIALSSILVAIILCVLLSVMANYLYYYFTSPTNKRIIDKLKKAGYECGMQEGKIVFRKNNCDWYLFVGDVSRRYRKVSIYLGFTLEELDKDHSLTNRMVCIVAGRNSAVATSWDGENNVRFLYHTVFTSTKDILREFSSATDAINAAASEFFTVKERLMDNVQSVNEHKVGFQYGEKADVETGSEVQDIRAEKE